MSGRGNKGRSTAATVTGFQSALKQVSHAHRPYENFANFMEAAYCAIAKRNALDEERKEALEQRYMKVVEKYAREPQAMTCMSDLLCSLTMTIPDYPGDFLGEAFMRAGFANEHGGQYFTPFSIYTLLVRFNYDKDDLTRITAEGRPVTVCDPACGSGGLILATAEYLTELGFDVQRHLLATLVDIDQLAFQMAYLQMTLKRIPAICVHANTLTLEEFQRSLTPAAIQMLIRDPAIFSARETKPSTAKAAQAAHDDVPSDALLVPADGGPPPVAEAGEVLVDSPTRQHVPAPTEAAPRTDQPLTLELFPNAEPSPVAAQRRRPLEGRPRLRGVSNLRESHTASGVGSTDSPSLREPVGQSADLFASALPDVAPVDESEIESQARAAQLEQVIAHFESGEPGGAPTPHLEAPKLTRIQSPSLRRPSLRSRR
jgi:N-6 DNA methylase